MKVRIFAYRYPILSALFGCRWVDRSRFFIFLSTCSVSCGERGISLRL